MSHGVRIWSAEGALQLDENSFTMRVVYSGLVTGSNTVAYQTVPVPGLTPENGAAFVVPIGSYNQVQDKQLETEVIAGAVRVYSYIRGREQYSNKTGVTMRLIVIRFS
ncbi:MULTISPECIES: hypothetical protein [unclassified Pseudomonas]|uniref:hypothetical protein n=1 Tax=unclassified Pseudomonas TaxID=196821 RepID=UPI0011ABFE77|nr:MULTISPECIES: hypothetical protein [unclassified Pseudomonas]TWC27728.1 hypothetical protein FBY05_101593 [Pseudomonas sp. SJZ083]TWC53932.1 hypothetical protein FBY01_101123 [Pseudomonas sp. SJZ077]